MVFIGCDNFAWILYADHNETKNFSMFNFISLSRFKKYLNYGWYIFIWNFWSCSVSGGLLSACWISSPVSCSLLLGCWISFQRKHRIQNWEHFVDIRISMMSQELHFIKKQLFSEERFSSSFVLRKVRLCRYIPLLAELFSNAILSKRMNWDSKFSSATITKM